jgi:hypothetical protein
MSCSRNSKLFRRNEAAGFTLLEIIAAFTVATVGIFGALQVHLWTMDSMRAMREDNIALQAVANELETLKALPFEALVPGPGQAFRSDMAPLEALHLASPAVTITPAEAPGLVEVKAEVRWVGEHGRRIERSLSTLIAARGSGTNG